ncbi:MAG: hypothetical protein ACMUIE_06525 [Thermoplasmatota archaeon]
MSFMNRVQAMGITHPFSMNKKLDQFLSENLPDLMDEYKIADRNDIADIDGQFEGFEKRMDELESWRKNFDLKLDESDRRMARLRTKYGVKGGE